MSRSILGRLVALVVVTFLGLYYILFDAVGLKLVDKPFTVHVDMPAAGGLYTDASVTYRGVVVGKVSALHLQKYGVIADLAIDHGTRIPSDVTASVRELTAAAEQYIDLVPPSPAGSRLTAAEGPDLHRGSLIPRDHTRIPVSIGALLNTVNDLVDSLHASDLNTLSSALATGLQGAGDNLHAIILDGNTLVSALDSAIPGTVDLIEGGYTVLSTFGDTNGYFQQFSDNLNSLSAQVAQSNSDLVALLSNGQSATKAVTDFLGRYGQPLADMVNGLGSSTAVAYARQGALQALFSVLPVLSSDLAQTASGGQLHFELTFNTRNTVCPYSTPMASPTSAISTVNLTGNCAAQAPDLLQRGADKAPTPNQG